LERIFEVIGTPNLKQWPEIVELPMYRVKNFRLFFDFVRK